MSELLFEYQPGLVHPSIAHGLATATEQLFEIAEAERPDLVLSPNLASMLVSKLWIYFSNEALDFLESQDIQNGRPKIDRQEAVNDLHDLVADHSGASIALSSIQTARKVLSHTNIGRHSAELLRYQPGAHLTRHTDDVHTTAISLSGEAVLFVGDDCEAEQQYELSPGDGFTTTPAVPHRVESGGDSMRYAILFANRLK